MQLLQLLQVCSNCVWRAEGGVVGTNACRGLHAGLAYCQWLPFLHNMLALLHCIAVCVYYAGWYVMMLQQSNSCHFLVVCKETVAAAGVHLCTPYTGNACIIQLTSCAGCMLQHSISFVLQHLHSKSCMTTVSKRWGCFADDGCEALVCVLQVTTVHCTAWQAMHLHWCVMCCSWVGDGIRIEVTSLCMQLGCSVSFEWPPYE